MVKVIADDEVQEFLHKFHYDPATGGHSERYPLILIWTSILILLFRDAMLSAISQFYFLPGAVQHVSRCILQCEECQHQVRQ